MDRDRSGIVGMKQEGAHIRAERTQCRLEYCICDSLKTFNPFPALMPVHFFQVIEVVLHTDGFVEPAAAVYDNAPILRKDDASVRAVISVQRVC